MCRPGGGYALPGIVVAIAVSGLTRMVLPAADQYVQMIRRIAPALIELEKFSAKLSTKQPVTLFFIAQNDP